MWLIVYSNDHAPLTVRPIYSSSKLRTAQMMIFPLIAMIALEKCCITSACLQWLCHSGERTVARGPLVFNLLTGDETWVHMFEPQRRADNKQWKRKDQNRPCIARRTISSKNMLYAIFFNSSRPVVQVPCPSGHTVTGWFYKNSVLKKVKGFYNKKRPSKGWSGVHLLHDNASSHKCKVVKSFLASEKEKVLNPPPYSPDLSLCEFFLFPRLKKMLSGNKYTSRSSLSSAIYQCLQQIPKEDYLSVFRDWVKRLQKCVSVKGEYFEGL